MTAKTLISYCSEAKHKIELLLLVRIFTGSNVWITRARAESVY